MSKERARRREERQREAAVLAAARAAEVERRERRDARVRAMTSWLPQRRSQPSGVLAERRRRQTRLLVFVVFVINLLVWLAFGDWAVRALVVMLSLLLTPLIHILMTSRK